MGKWSDPIHAAPTRFRVRVGKDEEFALHAGVTLVGRDAACPITILDTLASRRHARIECDGEEATIEDLGSRNGTRINDVLISGPHRLRAGDRVGIGSCELVISISSADDVEWHDEPTGLLSICSQCRHCFAATTKHCPRCGTVQGAQQPDPLQPRPEETAHARWSVPMLMEMVGKTMLTNNVKDAEKLMRRTALLVGDQLRKGSMPPADELHVLQEVARWIDDRRRDHHWGDWLARVEAEVAKQTQSASSRLSQPTRGVLPKA